MQYLACFFFFFNSNLSHGPKSYKTDQVGFCGLSLNHSISGLECSNEIGQKPWYRGLKVSLVSPKKIWSGLRCYRISVPSWFVLNLDVTMLHHCSNNCIGCQSTRELLLKHWLMCTNPSLVSLLSTLMIALFRNILVVPWKQDPLAPLILSCP